MSDERPWVTCVMIFLDGERFIDEAIRSVVDQCGFDDWELVLVDDGSSDASTTIARRWASADSRIRYLEHDGHANRGMSASRNAGVAAARGDFVGFLDCDDLWLPSRLAHARRVSEAHPDADLIVGATYRWHGWTGRADDVARDQLHVLPPVPTGVVLAPGVLFEAIYADPPWWNELAMCGFLVRQSVLMALGGLEAEYRGLFEDQVLYVKLSLGATAIVDPRPVALYRQHDASTCAVSIASGEWTPLGDSPPLRRFLDWMSEYVERTAIDDRSRQIARRNAAFDWASSGTAVWVPPVSSRWWRRVIPPPVRRAARRHRHRADRTPLAERWSEQFLRPAVAAANGRTLLVGSRRATRRWTSRVPLEPSPRRATTWRSAGRPTRHRRAQFDTIIVPLGAAHSPASSVARFVADRLAPGGTAYLVAPATSGLAVTLGRALPDAAVMVEPLGNADIGDALRRSTTVADGPMVLADRPDPIARVLDAITVRR